MINNLSNSVVSNILRKRNHDKRVLLFENVILNDVKKLFEQVAPDISNIQKPQTWEEFEELLKQQTKLEQLPPEFRKMAKRKWDEASNVDKKLKSGDVESESLMKEVEGKETAYTASTFFQQAGERVSELATDPETYKMLALGFVLTFAFPAAAPFVVIAGAAGAAASATQQASRGGYGGAAVDVTLGALPFASKNIRASFSPRGQLPQTRAPRSNAPSETAPSAPENLTAPESLKPSKSEFSDIQFKYVPYQLSGEMAELEPISKVFSDFQFNPWEFAKGVGEYVQPKRRGMPGTVVRRDGTYKKVSPYNLTDKELARIEKFGNMAEKEAIARAKQKKLGKAIGGSVGEKIEQSDTPFIKAVIDRYTAFQNSKVPGTEEAGKNLEFSGMPELKFVSVLPRTKLIPIIPQRPSAFGSLESYQKAISKQLERDLTSEELSYTEKVYNDDVRKKRIETSEKEVVPEVDYSKFKGEKTEKGPTRLAAEKTAAVGSGISQLGQAVPETIATKPPPAIVSRHPLSATKQYEIVPEIPPAILSPKPVKYASDLPVIDAKPTYAITSGAVKNDLSPNNDIKNIVAAALSPNTAQTNNAEKIPFIAPSIPSTTPKTPILGSDGSKVTPKPPLKLPGFPFEPRPFTDDGSGAGSVGRLTNQDVGIALDRIIGQRSGAYRIR